MDSTGSGATTFSSTEVSTRGSTSATGAVASASGSSVATPDSSGALSKGATTVSGSSFWFSATDSFIGAKISSEGFGGSKGGAGDDEAPPVVMINKS